jgi:hypothetical protein
MSKFSKEVCLEMMMMRTENKSDNTHVLVLVEKK